VTDTGWPGSRGDAHVLKFSKLWNSTANMIPAGNYLFGDSGYPNLRWLITPYPSKDKHASGTKGDFNFNHASTRVVVEQAFGVLKSRFRVLKGIEAKELALAPKIVTACIVLHNICIDRQDSWAALTPTTAPHFNPATGRHAAGSVPRGSGVGTDQHRYKPRGDEQFDIPTFTATNIPAQYRQPNPPPGASKAASHKRGGPAKRDELRDFVQGCPRCKLFGRREHAGPSV
jgi:hypothetical protein